MSLVRVVFATDHRLCLGNTLRTDLFRRQKSQLFFRQPVVGRVRRVRRLRRIFWRHREPEPYLPKVCPPGPMHVPRCVLTAEVALVDQLLGEQLIEVCAGLSGLVPPVYLAGGRSTNQAAVIS